MAKLRHHATSELDAAHKAALRYADAYMTAPARIDVGLRDELHRRFDAAQLVELTLDVVAWNKQKVPVALGTDREVREGELTPLRFDASGHVVVG